MALQTAGQVVVIPEAPPIPGLHFRSFGQEVDFETIASLVAGCRTVDRLEHVPDAREVARFYQSQPNWNPAEDTVFAEVGSTAVAYSTVRREIDTDAAQLYLHVGSVLPAWRHKGIGQTMLRQSERRLRVIAASHGGDGERFFEAFAFDTQPGKEVLLQREGYEGVRHHFLMSRPLVDIPRAMVLPDGLEMRPVHEEHHSAILDGINEAFHDHWRFVPITKQQFQAWREDPAFDPALWLVAWDDDQVAGMVLNQVRREENAILGRQRGWVSLVCVRRPWRRRGLAQALLSNSLRLLRTRGMDEAVLKVDSQNLTGALRLYESAGFRTIKRVTIYRKPLQAVLEVM